MAHDLVVAEVEILDIIVADEAARFRDGVNRYPRHLGDPRIKTLGRIALQRRPRERRQIIGQGEMLGLRERVLAESPLALHFGGRERRQLQRGAQRKTVAAELERAFEQRRQHQDSGNHDALLALHGAGDLGGAKSAVAFAEDEFRRADAAVLRHVKRNDLCHRAGVAVHAPECAAAVGLGRPAPAGADGIDQHQIGEGKPGVRIVDQADVGAVVAGHAELGEARTHHPEMEERRSRAGSAVEDKGQRTRRVIVASVSRSFGHIGGVEHRGRTIARLIEQRERSGGRRIGKLAARRVDAVLADRIARQQRENARTALLVVGPPLWLCS